MKYIRKIYEESVNSIEKDHLPVDFVGQIQYYFSDKNSLLPVRDVLNTQRTGHKTEPHIEIGAENFLKKCMQSNIVKSINRGAKYLFLLTRCKNRQLKNHYNNQYIVGYLKIENVLNIHSNNQDWKSLQGYTKIVTWDDSIPVLDYYTKNFDRPRIGKYGTIDRIMATEFLNRFKTKENIVDALIDEIKKLDKDNITCIGESCKFYHTICKRWN